MAQKAKKDLAKANTASLKTLHLLSLLINALFILNAILRPSSRSLKLYLILSTPAFASQFVLERSGRPTRDKQTGNLKSAGQDLAGGGLVGSLFDVVWVTWACVVLVLVAGDKAWWLWSVIPAYGGYQAFKLAGKAKGLTGLGGMGGGAAGAGGDAAPPPAMNRKQRRAA
ncbi:related to DUF788 domain protein [Cephalotrichum gorgonifer]|uniref:Related to DUF788 domain protein n=1 Tax=Cephalotrichum gorgonifer TaxID=2041049 RepID=A0AAE8MY27_9PEZI|nr:related to DUF788 domain protein [Cephalotrichum gorgonifer]